VLLLPLGVEIARRPQAGTASSPARRVVGTAAVLLAVVPALVWYWSAYQAAAPGSPLADRIFYSVRQSVGVHHPPHPLLASPDFYRQMLDDLTGVVLTPVGFVLVLAGFLHGDWRRYGPWFLAVSILVLALPLKFYEMNYYWMTVVAPLSIMAGLGWQVISETIRPGRRAVFALLAITVALSLRYAARPAWFTPEEDRAVVAAGKAVQQRTKVGQPVVTMHGTSIDLLYYCNRAGWAVAPDSPQLETTLKGCRRQGARYLVVAGPAAADEPDWLKPAAPAFQGDGFRIYRLEAL
jgi:hypothetical protein